MTSSVRPLGKLHLLTIAVLVGQEFLQNGMVSFASSYISGGIGAAPEEFSLAAAAYAAVAVVMIFMHRWWVERLGYRRFLHAALAFFALGAVICANADDVTQFVAGRMVGAIGGSAFFTAGRIQVLHHKGPARGAGLLWFGVGLLGGSSLAALLASTVVDTVGWRGVFIAVLPVMALAAVLVGATIPAHSPVEREAKSASHPAGLLSLAAGIFALQFVLERAQYDFFSAGTVWALLLTAAVLAIVGFIAHDLKREAPLVHYRGFVSGRYLMGLGAYFFCYVIGAIGAYTTPVFLVRGLGFPLQRVGWALSCASLTGLLVVPLLSLVLPRWPALRKYFLLALVPLFVYGWWMSGMSEEVSLTQLLLPLALHNGIFLTVAQVAAAFGTFRDVDEAVFSHAYQVKNVLREVASSTGISIATVVLQMRSTLHYQRLVENADPLGQMANASASGLAQFAALIARQATLMACQDYFIGLCVVAVSAGTVVMLQRKLV